MRTNLPINQKKQFKYSITFSSWDEDSLEAGETNDRGFEVKDDTDTIGEILYLANDRYGIYYPLSFGGWESTEPEQDTDYWEKGINKYYTLHITNTDGTDITQEENDFITFLLSNGRYEINKFREYAIGGIVGGAIAVGIGGLIAYYYFKNKKPKSPKAKKVKKSVKSESSQSTTKKKISSSAKSVTHIINGKKRKFPIKDAWRKEHNVENQSENYEVPQEDRFAMGGDASEHYYEVEYGEGGVARAKEIITNKIGLNEENADFLTSQSEKFAIWLADSIVKAQMSISNELTKEQVVEFINKNPNTLKGLRQRIRGILDWLESRMTPKQNLRELSFIQAEEKAKQWHDELIMSGGDIDYIEPKENIILKTYPTNEFGKTYYWVMLPSNICDLESSRMGHCGKSYSSENLISFRSTYKNVNGEEINDSHITIGYGDGLFYQAKGKQNKKPLEKYFPYIFDFIKSLVKGEIENLTFNGFASEHASKEDYGWEDMTKQELTELFELNPNLFSDFAGKYMLYEAGLSVERPNTTIVIEKSPEYVADLLRLDRDLSEEVVEKVLTGDTFDWFSGSDSWRYYYDNAGDYVDDLNEANYEAVIDKIVELTGVEKSVVKENGAKHYLNGVDEETEGFTFEDIKRSIASAMSSAEESAYVKYYYEQIESALSELGTIKKLNYEGLEIEIDLENLMSISAISSYMKDLDTENLEDVFFEAESQGEIELPELSIDDRYSAYPEDEDFNANFDVDMYEKGGSLRPKTLTKKTKIKNMKPSQRKAQGGDVNATGISKEDYFLVVHNWVYFTFNYPMGFVKDAFSSSHLSDHLQEKFSSSYTRYGSVGVLMSFWANLDNKNRRILSLWIKNNYFSSSDNKSKLLTISDDDYAKIITHWNTFCFNFPYGFKEQIFGDNLGHYEHKWIRAYESAGATGVVNKFFTELSMNNQRLLTDWVYDNYKGITFADGGDVYVAPHKKAHFTWIMNNYGFVIPNREDVNYTMSDFAKDIKKTYSLDNPRNKEAYDYVNKFGDIRLFNSADMDKFERKMSEIEVEFAGGGAIDLSNREKAEMFSYLDGNNWTLESFMEKFNKTEEETHDIIDAWALSRGLRQYAGGGRVTTNDGIIEAFLTSNRELKVGNLSTHYNQYDNQILLRNYYTLIAIRKGNDVEIKNNKYSKTTTIITNKVKSMALNNRMNVKYVDKFADGGLVVKNDSDLQEVAKYMTNAVKKHRWDLKDLIHYFEQENNFDYKKRVKIWEEMNGYEMPKTYNNIYEMLKRISEANGSKFADGGEAENTFVNVLLDYGFVEKRSAYGVRHFYNKLKDYYASLDEYQRRLDVYKDDDMVVQGREYSGYSIRELIDYLNENGFKSGNKFADGGEAVKDNKGEKLSLGDLVKYKGGTYFIGFDGLPYIIKVETPVKFESRTNYYKPSIKEPIEKIYFKDVPQIQGEIELIAKYNDVRIYADGGEADLDYNEIFNVLKSKIDDAMDDIPNKYESASQFTGEEIEHESRSGFIPYTDGGYQAVWIETLGALYSSGYNLPTKPLDDEMNRQIDYNLELARESFGSDYPEIVEELGEENIDYNSLVDAGYQDEAEEFSNAEMDMMWEDTILMRILANYYNPENSRAKDGKHTIRLFGDVNLESPYHRTGNLDDSHEYEFTFNSIAELESEMNKGLKQVIAWFEGEMYNDSTAEMKVRRMKKGGSTKYAKGGILGESARLEYITDAYASFELRDKLKEALGLESEDEKLGDKVVISFAYTDYGGDFLDKVAIEYFQETYPENTLVEATGWGGQNAYVFGEPAKEWIETTEDYPLGFEDIEDFYYEKQNEQEAEDFNYFLDEITDDYNFDREEAFDWLMENKGGYYGMTTQGLDFSYEDLTNELVLEGIIEPKEEDEEEYAKGGGVKSPKDIFAEYEENEGYNRHSENVVLLAKNFGSEQDVKDAKAILKKHIDTGHLTDELRKRRNKLDSKLYPKLIEALDNKYAGGGSVEEIIENINPIATKFEGNSRDGFSVMVEDANSNFKAWVDVYIDDNDVRWDWNQYIFHTDNSKDVFQSKMQDDMYVADYFSSEAINYLEQQGAIQQDEKAHWSYTDKYEDGGEAGEYSEEVDKILENLEPEAVKFEGNSREGFSVLVKDKNSDFNAWVDVYMQGSDVTWEWNQYIFARNNSDDMLKSELQDNIDIADYFSSEAINYLEQQGAIQQDENADWSYTDKYKDGGTTKKKKLGAEKKSKIEITEDKKEGKKYAKRTLVKENNKGEKITYELSVGIHTNPKEKPNRYADGFFEIYATDEDDNEYFYAEGGLWIKNGRIYDYDGVYELSEKLRPLMSALNLNAKDVYAEGGKVGMIRYYIGGLVSEDIPFEYNGEEEDINYEVGFHEGGIDLETFKETPSGYYVRIMPYGSTDIRRFIYPEKDIEIAYLSELRAITMLLFEADKDTKENQKIAIKEGKKNLPKLLKYMTENLEEEDRFSENVRKVQDAMWGGDEDEDDDEYAGGGSVKKDKLEQARDYWKELEGQMTAKQKKFYNELLKRRQPSFEQNFNDSEIAEYINGEIIEQFGVDLGITKYQITGVNAFKLGFKYIAYREAIEEPEFWEEMNEYAEGGEVEDWMEEALASLIEETGFDDLEITYVGNSKIKYEFMASDGDVEYRVFQTEGDAEETAIEQVREDLEESPENFNQDWLMNYIDGGDFFEEALNEMNQVYVDDIESESDSVYENRLIAELVENGLMDEEDAKSDYAEPMADNLKSDYVALLTEGQLDEGNNGLNYFIYNFGEEETYKMVRDNNLIDIDEASKDAVNVDGIGHFLSSYDGETLYLSNDCVAYRTN